MDKLAKSGIILENHYVQPICTPTRSALMTGYYPIHTGRQVSFKLIDYTWTLIHTYYSGNAFFIQTSVLWPQEPKGLYTNYTLMPEYLQNLGYKTHAIGKWVFIPKY